MAATYENPLSNLSYVNKDFQAIYPELLDYVKKVSYKWDPSISDESDPGVILLKLCAIIADKNNYNIDKNTLELFPQSVTQEGNARALFEQLGYRMKWYRSATTNVSFKWIGDSDKTNILTYTIPQFSMVCDEESSIVYTLKNKVQITSDGETADVEAIQGVITDYLMNDDSTITSAHLDSNNRIYFPDVLVAENGIFICNANQSNYDDWSRVDNLAVEQLGSKVYKFGVTRTGAYCYIEFPSDIEDLIGQGLQIKYVVTGGYNGNTTSRTLEKFYSDVVITDPADETATLILNADNVMIANFSTVTNGKDPETIDEAYANYKNTIGVFNTLVSLRDYNNYINTSGLVSNSYVCDRTNDIQSSYKIISNQGEISKRVLQLDQDDLAIPSYDVNGNIITAIAPFILSSTAFTPDQLEQFELSQEEYLKYIATGDALGNKLYFLDKVEPDCSFTSEVVLASATMSSTTAVEEIFLQIKGKSEVNPEDPTGTLKTLYIDNIYAGTQTTIYTQEITSGGEKTGLWHVLEYVVSLDGNSPVWNLSEPCYDVNTYAIQKTDAETYETKIKPFEFNEETGVISNAMNAFDLKLYALQKVDIIQNNIMYNKSFEILRDVGDHDMSSSVTNIVSADGILSDVKSIQHDFKHHVSNKICMLKNKYPLTIKIVPQYKLTQIQINDITENILKALYDNLNSSKIEFGIEIPYDNIYDIIAESDERIKTVVLDTPTYTTYAIYLDENGVYKEIAISDNFTEAYICGKLNEDGTFTPDYESSPVKNTSYLYLDTHAVISDDSDIKSYILYSYNSSGVYEIYSDKINDFRIDIYAKSVLNGNTQFLTPDTTYDYRLNQNCEGLTDSIYKLTTNTNIKVCNKVTANTEYTSAFNNLSTYYKNSQQLDIDVTAHRSTVYFNTKKNLDKLYTLGDSELLTIYDSKYSFRVDTTRGSITFVEKQDDSSLPIILDIYVADEEKTSGLSHGWQIDALGITVPAGTESRHIVSIGSLSPYNSYQFLMYQASNIVGELQLDGNAVSSVSNVIPETIAIKCFIDSSISAVLLGTETDLGNDTYKLNSSYSGITSAIFYKSDSKIRLSFSSKHTFDAYASFSYQHKMTNTDCGQYTLGKNETLQFFAPNLITNETYSQYVKYQFKLSNVHSRSLRINSHSTSATSNLINPVVKNPDKITTSTMTSSIYYKFVCQDYDSIKLKSTWTVYTSVSGEESSWSATGVSEFSYNNTYSCDMYTRFNISGFEFEASHIESHEVQGDEFCLLLTGIYEEKKISPNTEYQLQSGESITFYWSTSTDTDVDDDSVVYRYRRYEQGDIICPDFELRSKNNSIDDEINGVYYVGEKLSGTEGNLPNTSVTVYVSGVATDYTYNSYIKSLYDSKYVLSGTQSIKNRIINSVNIKKSSSNCYWALNDDRQDSNGKFVLFKKGETSYTLQSGEYFIYTNPSMSTLIMLGTGTKLVRSSNDENADYPEWSIAGVSYDDVVSLGIDAFTTTDWFQIPSKYELVAVEMQYISLNSGVTIQMLPASSTATCYEVVFNNSGYVIDGGANMKLSDFKITYKDEDSTEFTELPTMAISGAEWIANSILSLTMSSKNAQALYGNQSIEYFVESDDTSKFIRGYNVNPVYVLANRELDMLGGKNINTKILNADGQTYDYLKLYVYTNSEDTDDNNIVYYDDYMNINMDNTEDYYQSITRTFRFKLPIGQYILPLKNLNTSGIRSLSLQVNGEELRPVNKYLYNLAEYGVYYLQLDIDESTYPEDYSDLLVTMTAELYPNTTKTLTIVKPFKYDQGDFDSEQFNIIFNRIVELDYDNYYDYTYVVDKDEEVVNPLAAQSFLDENHIFNAFTISQIDTVGSDIYITNKIK